MIYTVTFNPSLDYVVSVEEFQPGRTNRTDSERLFPGGKGINVSIVLNNLGIDNTALGFVAGFTGDEICRKVDELGIKADFIQLDEGHSRINVKLKSPEGTEINSQGPVISASYIEALLHKLEALVDGDYLVLAGSIPASVSKDIYRDIISRLQGKKISIVVDAAGALLMSVLKYHPFLIKPNHRELGDLFGVNIENREEVLPYARKLQEMGAGNVLVSLAGDGAVLLAEDGSSYQTAAPEGTLENGVGAGDSMVAGFLAGWIEQKDYRHAFLMGVAAGSASAFSAELAKQEAVLKLLQSF